MNKKSEIFRKKRRSNGYIERLKKRELLRNTICEHGMPILRCWACVQNIELEKNPKTIFIKGN